ncbi:beta strand repeat-containing protein [Sphingomonas tabacisoli]|uniref:Beta strand repeat-containing protein n=1 Tax=Sphingomonas tabacisoli TaxID=2249466 RepID=A0ABW4I2P2_9SPHN
MFAYLNSAALLRSRRARLLAGCALAAAMATPAMAQQAFKATPDIVQGSVSITQGQTISTGLRDTVSVSSRQSVINWTPNDTAVGGGAISILPQGNELVFTANPSTVAGAYTVLNRIIPNDPSRPVQFDGHVQSQFDSGYGATQGGSIWFYSPGGIIAGATSRFDVGSLVLSANDINFSNGLFNDGSASNQVGTIQFRGAVDGRSSVTIQPGAVINAKNSLSGSTYVALVAPRINQGGTISVEGSAALVAAESADITIPVSGGLFDIQVQSGSFVNTAGETTLTHSGTTQVLDAAATGQARRVYLMAVPKNDAVTMLVSGAVGYAPAAQAVAQNGAIVLTTASTVFGDGVQEPIDRGTITVTGGRFGNSVQASAQNVNFDTSTAAIDVIGNVFASSPSGAVSMTALGGRDINVAGALSFTHINADRDGNSSLSLTANAGSTIHAGSIHLSTSSFGLNDTGYGATSATGGTVTLQALGGIITSDAEIDLTSNATGGRGSNDGASAFGGGNGTGGTIKAIASNGGTINANDRLLIDVNGFGGEAGYGSGSGGLGTGGTALIDLSNNSALNLGSSSVIVEANGYGGRGGDNGVTAAGDGHGGAATVNIAASRFNALAVSVSADGLFPDDSFPAWGGSGTGGTVSVSNTAGSAISVASGNLVLSANGQAGDRFGFFNDVPVKGGTGGTVTFVTDASSVSLGEGALLASADGIAGYSSTATPSPIFGRGGSVTVTINAANPNDVESQFQASSIGLSADGRSNLPEADRSSVPHGSSATGVGGTVLLNLTGGPVQTGSVNLSASGTGANSDYDTTAGAGYAGHAELALNGGALTTSSINILAEAFGGDGAFAESGYGGAGVGGNAGVGTNPFTGSAGAFLTGSGGSIQADTILVSANATGGFGGDGQIFGSSPVNAAAGGQAFGASAIVDTNGVNLTFGSLSATAVGQGGNGGEVRYSSFFEGSQTANGGAGGTGQGGEARVTIAGGTLGFDGINAGADGIGGNGGQVASDNEGGLFSDATGKGGNGGDGTGGVAAITFVDATIPNNPTLFAAASGTGGDGGAGASGGSGGAGGGGDALVRLDGGTADLLRIGVFASGEGGFSYSGQWLDGGAGGSANGGTARFEAANGAVLNIPDFEQGDPFTLDASATAHDGASGGSFADSGVGGKGGRGGNANGGTASATFDSGAIVTVNGFGNIEAQPPSLVVTATAGSGGSGGIGNNTGNSGGAGGDGGTGRAGTALFNVTGANVSFTELFANATATYGFGGSGGHGQPDPVTGITTFAPSGAFGSAFGGIFELNVADGDAGYGGATPGKVNIGSMSADLGASGGFDGSLLISDTGTDSNGGITFDSLFARGSNGSDSGESDFEVRSNKRTIFTTGTVQFDVTGTARFSFQDTGSFAAGSDIDVFSRGGTVVTHIGRPDGTFSLDAPTINISGYGDSDAQDGSRLRGQDYLYFNSYSGNVHLADGVAGNQLIVSAFGNASVGNLTAGDSERIGDISIGAGQTEGYVPGNAIVTGTVEATGNIDIRASTDALIQPGAQVIADRAVSILTGDDIVIGAGALVRAANNPPPETGYGASDPLQQLSQLRLMAGAFDTGLEPEGNVASIILHGTLEAPNRTLFMSAGAVQADPSTRILADNLYVRLNNIPVGDQVPSNDFGQLTGTLCLEGSVCLGTANVNNIVRIGETGYEPINLRLNGGIDAVDVLLRAQSIALGQNGISNNIAASDRLTIEALGSSLTLNGPIAIEGGSDVARVASFRNITGAAATISAPGTLDLYAGNNITLGAVAANTIRTVDFDGGVLNAGGITVPGTIAVGQITSGTDLALTAGKDITVDRYAVTGAATLTAANGAITVATDAAATNGTTATAKSVTLNGLNGLKVTAATATAGDVTLATKAGDLVAGTVSASGGATLTAAGAIKVASIDTTAGVTATGASVDLTSQNALRVIAATATSGDVSLVAGNGIKADTVSAKGTATLKSGTGPLVVTRDLVAGNGLILAAPSIDITAQNGLNVLQADATAGDLKLTTVAGTLAAGKSSATGAITLTSGGDLTATSLKSGTGGITLAASNGSVKVTNDIVGGPLQVTAKSLDLTAQGDLNLAQGTATAGDITLASANGGITLGQVSASNALKATTPGLMTINGTVSAANIALTSKDIAIGANAQLGNRTQTALTLTSTADRTFLGDATGTGYRLDADEFTRIAGRTIDVVSAPQNAQGTAFTLLDPAGTNVVIGSMTFDGAQLGGEGTLTVRSPRSIGFIGNVQFKNFNNDQTVSYQATNDISLAAETGLVTIKNSSGGLAGTLVLDAQQIHAMSAKARSEIAGLQLNDVRQRLGTNDQLQNDGGYFQANKIIVKIGRLLFIQNSGINSDDRNDKRGFTTNSLTLQAGDGPVQVVINGRVGTAVGEAIIPATTRTGSFDPQSGFNTCLVGVTCFVVTTPEPVFDPSFVLSQSRDQVEDKDDDDKEEEALQAAQKRPDPIIQFIDAPVSRFDPVIDQPVTGAGNEDFWEVPASQTPTP